MKLLEIQPAHAPENLPEARELAYDPNRPAWTQLTAEGPQRLVGTEWQDEFGNTRRVSSYDSIQRPTVDKSKTLLPRFKRRKQIDGGYTFERSTKYTPTTEDVDCWMVDVFDANGNLQEVVPYFAYTEPPKIQKSDIPYNFFIYSEDRELMRKYHAQASKGPTEHNEMRMYFHDKTGAVGKIAIIDEKGKHIGEEEGSTLPRHIDQFSKRDLAPAPDMSDTVHIPAALKDGKISLDSVESQAERMGRKDIAGLTWTDKDGNVKQISRNYSVPSKRFHYGGFHSLDERLPERKYIVKTVGVIKDFASAPMGIGEKDFESNPELEVVIDPTTGKPLRETQAIDIIGADELQKELAYASRFESRLAEADIHWEIPGLRSDERNDAGLIEHEVAALEAENLITNAPAVYDWLARRALDGAAPEALRLNDEYEGISFEDALERLNSYKRLSDDDDEAWSDKLQVLAEDAKERKYADQLAFCSRVYGMDNIMEVADGLAESAQVAMEQLGLALRPEHAESNRILRSLMMARYYAQNRGDINQDGFTMTASDPFVFNAGGLQVHREAIDLRVGESFADDAIKREVIETMKPREFTNPEDGKTWSVMIKETAKSFTVLSQAITLLHHTNKSTSSEITELLKESKDDGEELTDAQYARLGRLLNRLAVQLS